MPWRQPSARSEIDKQTLGSHFATGPHTTKCCGSRPTGSQDGRGKGHELNSQKCVCFAGRCLLDTYSGELEPSYTRIEQGLWQSLY